MKIFMISFFTFLEKWLDIACNIKPCRAPPKKNEKKDLNFLNFPVLTCVFPPPRSCIKLLDNEADGEAEAKNDDTILLIPKATNS